AISGARALIRPRSQGIVFAIVFANKVDHSRNWGGGLPGARRSFNQDVVIEVVGNPVSLGLIGRAVHGARSSRMGFSIWPLAGFASFALLAATTESISLQTGR